jgi:hypothetical protein
VNRLKWFYLKLILMVTLLISCVFTLPAVVEPLSSLQTLSPSSTFTPVPTTITPTITASIPPPINQTPTAFIPTQPPPNKILIPIMPAREVEIFIILTPNRKTIVMAEPAHDSKDYRWILSRGEQVILDTIENEQILETPSIELSRGNVPLSQIKTKSSCKLELFNHIEEFWVQISEVTVYFFRDSSEFKGWDQDRGHDDEAASSFPDQSTPPPAEPIHPRFPNLYPPPPEMGSEFILFSADNTLYMLDPYSGSTHMLVDSLGEVTNSIVVDPIKNMIYLNTWPGWNQLIRVSIDSPMNIDYQQGPLEGGQGMAIDFQARKIFMGIYYEGVFVRDLDNNSGWNQIVQSQQLGILLGQRGQLQVDPLQQHVYFRTAFNGDCGQCRWIYRVNYDGSNLVPIVKANGGDALELDIYDGKMYYTDYPGESTIKKANLDGTDVETILSIDDPAIYLRQIVIDTEAGNLYSSFGNLDNVYARYIGRSDLDGGNFVIIYNSDDHPEIGYGSIAFYRRKW